MKQRSRDRLLLQHQAGAEFHFTADAKRVDALIAACLARVWSHNLPVIILCAVIDGLLRLMAVR